MTSIDVSCSAFCNKSLLSIEAEAFPLLTLKNKEVLLAKSLASDISPYSKTQL